MSLIRKGLGIISNLSIESEEKESLKCPKCNLIHMIGKEERQVFEEILVGEEIRKKIKQRNENKLQNFFKTKES